MVRLKVFNGIKKRILILEPDPDGTGHKVDILRPLLAGWQEVR